MGTYENRIEQKADRLGWSTVLVASVANKFGIRGASESTLSKAFKGLKELSTHDTALPLDLLLGRFVKMAETFAPFELRLDDPAKAAELLQSFEAGELAVC
jgi:hypothetical protein